MTKIRGIVNRKVKESTTMYKVRALPPPLPPPPAAAAASTACGHRRGADRRDPPAAARTYVVHDFSSLSRVPGWRIIKSAAVLLPDASNTRRLTAGKPDATCKTLPAGPPRWRGRWITRACPSTHVLAGQPLLLQVLQCELSLGRRDGNGHQTSVKSFHN